MMYKCNYINKNTIIKYWLKKFLIKIPKISELSSYVELKNKYINVRIVIKKLHILLLLLIIDDTLVIIQNML